MAGFYGKTLYQTGSAFAITGKRINQYQSIHVPRRFGIALGIVTAILQSR